MNLKHLGDSLDHCKGSMFEILRGELNDLHVVPMFADGDKWVDENLTTYADLLRIKQNQLLARKERFANTNRKLYFDSISESAPKDCDLFLDPDTGIESLRICNKEHISREEICKLLKTQKRRILLICQHRHQICKAAICCAEKLNVLRKQESLKGVHCFAYNAGAAATIFISWDENKITRATECLSRFCCPDVEKRIIE